MERERALIDDCREDKVWFSARLALGGVRVMGYLQMYWRKWHKSLCMFC